LPKAVAIALNLNYCIVNINLKGVFHMDDEYGPNWFGSTDWSDVMYGSGEDAEE